MFQATRLIGPAIASLLIAQRRAPGWVFAVNAACYLGPTIGLLRLRPVRSRARSGRHPRARERLRTAARYLRGRPDVLWTIFLVGMLGTFGLNFPIVLTAMAKSTFHGNASTYGLFNIVLGDRLGGRRAARRGRRPPAAPRHRDLGGRVRRSSRRPRPLAPDLAVFLALLVGMGFVNLVFQAMANASVQLAVDPGAARPRHGPVHAGLHRRHPHRRPGHRRDHQPLRRPGRHGHLRCRAGLAAVVMAAAVARRNRRERHARPAPADWEVLETLLGESAFQEQA